MNPPRTMLCSTLLTAVSCMAGCVAKPDRDQKGLLTGAQRVLALDFGRSVTGPRVNRLRRLPSALGRELTRSKDMLRLPNDRPLTSVAGSELRRTKRISDLGVQLLGSEANRRPNLLSPSLRKHTWPSSFEFAQNTANNIDTFGRLLGPGQHPLNEIDDVMHRTDHTDTRPERTFWERLRRRLPF